MPEGLLSESAISAAGAIICGRREARGIISVPNAADISASMRYRRIEMVADEGTFEEWDKGMAEPESAAFSRV